MEPDVPFALLAAAQLLAVAAFAGLAASATIGRARARAWTLLALLGGIGVATAEAITAADLGDPSSVAVGWLRAGGAIALLLWWLTPSPALLSVAPLAAGAGPGWVAAGGFVLAAGASVRRGLPGRLWLALGLVLSGAAAAVGQSADTSSGAATAVLVLRLAGAGAVLVHLGLLARRSVLTKVVGAILAAVTITAVAATSIVGTTVADRLSSQQSGRVRQAAIGEVGDLDTQGVQSSVLAAIVAAQADDASRQSEAAALSSLCFLPNTFAASVTRGGKVTYFKGSGCGSEGTSLPQLTLDDLVNQATVKAVLADGGTKAFGYAVLQGVQPIAVKLVAVRDLPPKTSSAAVVFGIILDQKLLAARKRATQLDATVITTDGRVASSTLSPTAAAALAADHRIVAALAHPPAEGSATVDVSTGQAPTIAAVQLADDSQVSALLVLSSPAAAVSGVQRTVLQVLVVAAVLIGLVVALLGLLLGQRIAEPLRRLTLAMEAVRRGDLTARTSVTSSDEVGQLAQTFDAMTVSLAEADEEIRSTAAVELATRVRLETVLASMTDALIVCDPDGVVTSVNPAAVALLGDAAVGAALTAVVRGSGPDGKPLVGPSTRAAEGMLFRRSGPPVAVAVASSPLSDGQGTVVLIRDMTREAQVEQMKTEFLSNVSHELRTPLTPIQGYAEILARRPDLGPDKVAQYSSVMYDSARRLSRIVDLLVDVASLDAGRIVPEAEDVDVRAFLDRRLELWRAAQPVRARDLRKRVAAGLPAARVDATWLGKAVDELIDNALKFSEPGKAVTLSATLEGTVIRLAVKDGGRGLDAQARAALFSDFEQGDGSATRVRDGLGLGLSFTRRVADVVGMRLDVESAGTGKGSTFSLLVPRAGAARRRRP